MWTLYASPRSCPFCTQAQQLLQVKGIRHDVIVAPDLLAALRADHGLRPDEATYPQIVCDGQLVGGLSKLRDRLDEPLLDDSMARFTPIPVRHHDIWDMFKLAQSLNWLSEEVDYAGDRTFGLLRPDERRFVEHILAFFAGADGIVQENLMVNFKAEVQYAEARNFYAHQGYIEAVHSETYGKLLTTYIPEEERAVQLVQGIQTIPCVRRKAAWSLKYLDRRRLFAERLLAFICVEGIMFSSSFCAIFWIKQTKENSLPALTYANDLIARDEGLHQQFGELLYTRHLKHKLPASRVHEIVGEAVDAEIDFVHEAIGDMRDAHLDAGRTVEYVKYVADRMLKTLGYPALYNASQPFPWMVSISLRGINNFFEKRSETYRDARVGDADRPVFGEAIDDF